jgi:sulfatase maturation enzyme AslB (radical SAM superfamily)
MNIMYKTTSSCNANCIYCFDKVSQDNKRQLMPIDQLIEIFSHLCDLDNNIQ